MNNPQTPDLDNNCRVADLFNLPSSADACESLRIQTAERLTLNTVADRETRLDIFSNNTASCAFVRFTPGCGRDIGFVLKGAYRVTTCASGGWMLLPARGEDDLDSYWLPQAPKLRRLDKLGHVLEERDARLSDIILSPSELVLRVEIPADQALDWAIWRLPSAARNTLGELRALHPIETQPRFLWGSHTRYRRPADVYLHLVHGHVYETLFNWPKYWRICSENDAHALHTILSGLGSATGKELYRLLRAQLLLSVIDRQGEDGGWRHGEWSDRMESHYRLHCSAMHMLMDALSERDDPELLDSLRRAAAFIAKQHDRLAAGIWFLHDELEHSTEGMNQGPFHWYPSRVLGKSESNMLVLNTQLDATIALHRYGEITGDRQYSSLVDSARKATDAVLRLDTANLLYRGVFWAIGLTLLPTSDAKALPLSLRAVKRLTWKHLIPRLSRIKTAFPRIVMPGGYVDRALSVGALSDAYLSVNAMDLARYLRQFGEKEIRSLISGAIGFARDRNLLARWCEDKSKEYALGFWAEALYNLCTIDSSPEYRAMLAETMLAIERRRLGIPPSLLGTNSEAVSKQMQLPCPSTRDRCLRIANLSRDGKMELIVVNPTHVPVRVEWDIPPCRPVHWLRSDSVAISGDTELVDVPAGGWYYGSEDP